MKAILLACLIPASGWAAQPTYMVEAQVFFEGKPVTRRVSMKLQAGGTGEIKESSADGGKVSLKLSPSEQKGQTETVLISCDVDFSKGEKTKKSKPRVAINLGNTASLGDGELTIAIKAFRAEDISKVVPALEAKEQGLSALLLSDDLMLEDLEMSKSAN